MKTPYLPCPAAHSMDTDWFAVDEQGKVGVFFSSETGAVPDEAFVDADQSGELVPDVLAAAIQLRAKEVKWKKRAGDDVYEVALIAAKKPVFGAQVKSGVLRLVSKAPLALYAPVDELDDEEAFEEMLEDEHCLGFLLRDDLAGAAGFAQYLHPGGDATGEYVRVTAPGKRVKLAAALEKKLAALKLPLDFAKARKVELWKYVEQDDVTQWESGVPYDGVSASSREDALKPRRLEFVGGGSNKFWEAWVEGATLHVRFGRIGTDGQLQSKRLADERAAVKEAESQLKAKLAKGYLAQSASASDEAAAPGTKWAPCTLGAKAFRERYGTPLPPEHRVLARAVTGEGFVAEEVAIEFKGFDFLDAFVTNHSLRRMGGSVTLPEPLEFLAHQTLVGLHPVQPPAPVVRFVTSVSSSGAFLTGSLRCTRWVRSSCRC